MAEINIANAAGRDAVVVTSSMRSARKIRWLDHRGRQAQTIRLLKASIDRDAEALAEAYGSIAAVAPALVDGDPEIDFEQTGRALKDTSRVYIDARRQVVHRVSFWEIVHNPDGSVRDRRPRNQADPNLTGETPLKWSGRYVKKDEAVRKFVFSGKVQLRHVNGLTYDFLYGMAKELEAKNSLLALGAGPKGNQPLILRRGGSPYRGFLEGRTQGDRYALILHFTNLELKTPDRSDNAGSTEEAAG